MLHFRRINDVLTGYRWFDIKRYGIEITHQIGRTRTETLKLNDPRRAFQVPIEAIEAGLEPTPRTVTQPSSSEMTKANFSLTSIK